MWVVDLISSGGERARLYMCASLFLQNPAISVLVSNTWLERCVHTRGNFWESYSRHPREIRSDERARLLPLAHRATTGNNSCRYLLFMRHCVMRESRFSLDTTHDGIYAHVENTNLREHIRSNMGIESFLPCSTYAMTLVDSEGWILRKTRLGKYWT